jgi:hypothetical protein
VATDAEWSTTHQKHVLVAMNGRGNRCTVRGGGPSSETQSPLWFANFTTSFSVARLYNVLVMVYNTHTYQVFGLCPSSRD